MNSALPEVDYETGLTLVPKLLAKGRIATAIRWADRLCAHHPDDPRAHNQAGLAHQRLQAFGDAMKVFRRAAILQPDAGEIWANLGNCARRSADLAAALRNHHRAALCAPDVPAIRFTWGISLLSAGDMASGFREFEHRAARSTTLARFGPTSAPLWDRRPVPGRRLLIAAEQGAGDTVQFLRFVRPLAESGMHVTVACHSALDRLVRSVRGVAATVPNPPGEFAHDGFELLMSLPACLGVDRSALPVAARYIEPPAARKTLPETGRLRVGLCWTGSPAQPEGEPRRIPFACLKPLLAIEGVEFYSLQVGVGRDAIVGEAAISDLAPYIGDFADTAAMVDQMDLVITIDTSVAHIAGALGRNVWTLLPQVADWRWGQEGEATPWYPTMRLLRQSRMGHWQDVVDRAREDLRALRARRSQ